MSYADIKGNEVTVHNIRDCRWRSLDDFSVSRYDKTFDLDKLNGVDFIVVPFNESPSLGHTMLSFDFDDDGIWPYRSRFARNRARRLTLIKGFFQEYEIIYVVASERDVIGRRVNCDLSDVFLYRSTATPEQTRKLFLDVMQRVNKLYKEPEFYDTLTNNCTTNIRNHINHLKPDKIPYDYRVLLPGYSDRLAYELGLIERHGSFEETRLRARVNYQAYLHRDESDVLAGDSAIGSAEGIFFAEPNVVQSSQDSEKARRLAMPIQFACVSGGCVSRTRPGSDFDKNVSKEVGKISKEYPPTRLVLTYPPIRLGYK